MESPEDGDQGQENTRRHTRWPTGAEWSLGKLIRIGDAYGFRGGQSAAAAESSLLGRHSEDHQAARGADAALAAAEVQSCSI